MSDSLIILGDVCPEDGFPQQFATGDASNEFHDLLPVLKNASVVIANMEAPLTDCKIKLKKNSVCLKGNPSDACVLSNVGITAVSLANNHILDYGIEGYHDTLRHLDKNGILYYGAGTSNSENTACYFQINDKRIGVLSFAEREFNCATDYGAGAYCWDDLTGPQIVAHAKSDCDYLIVQYHGGIEHYIYPSPYLQKKCRIMAEMGADFVTCQHSHCIGTRENWKGCEILYGQGNTIFGYIPNNESWNNGLIAQLDIGEKLNISYIPITATPDGEILVDSVQAEKILNHFTSESEKITNTDFIKSEWDKFCNSCKDMYIPMTFARGRVFNKLNRITKGRLIRIFTNGSSRRNVMNLIRCDAHREVVQTILENDFYG